mmetsp:Transcript_13674/g.18714  ORF Transcript_13674/g.18714 Transcript_13674/m.18714 type:complete len:247 (-) Transcript_13674:2-742(-)|eukprot:CAMPEP_0170078910 /NCGR_PEP_ID=MMETSP0019_2-20121128/15422_1 /TAXON_ID=98059 /ORGANISM="Dinobryon sp., Strain UTEXLB2267" /LENGTH=246 /DNA_ID=CAMNT_0010292101 /DNA_START=50 /DNA_END=790 /DNA_ORIENTATION=+
MAEKKFAHMMLDMMVQQKDLIQAQITQLEDFLSVQNGVHSALSVPSAPKPKRQKVEVDPNKPKRSPSGYQLYMTEKSGKLRAENPNMTPKDVMTQIAADWQKCSESDKAKYLEKAASLKTVYDQQIKDYNATPAIADSSSSSSTIPATVRKDSVVSETVVISSTSAVTTATVPSQVVSSTKAEKKGAKKRAEPEQPAVVVPEPPVEEVVVAVESTQETLEDEESEKKKRKKMKKSKKEKKDVESGL